MLKLVNAKVWNGTEWILARNASNAGTIDIVESALIGFESPVSPSVLNDIVILDDGIPVITDDVNVTLV